MATVQAARDAIEVAGTESDMTTGSFDGLYDQAGACNGQPYYKCTCCTDYDQFLIDKCATPGECDEGWSETRCMSDSPGGGWHHYVWYSSDDEAWQLRMYVGDGDGSGDGSGKISSSGSGLASERTRPPFGAASASRGNPAPVAVPCCALVSQVEQQPVHSQPRPLLSTSQVKELWRAPQVRSRPHGRAHGSSAWLATPGSSARASSAWMILVVRSRGEDGDGISYGQLYRRAVRSPRYAN